MSKPLTLSDLHKLSQLASAVEAGSPITYVDQLGNTRWGIARAFTHEDGGFLGAEDDVRDAFVWLSGGSHFGEVWVEVAYLAAGVGEGWVALDFRPNFSR